MKARERVCSSYIFSTSSTTSYLNQTQRLLLVNTDRILVNYNILLKGNDYVMLSCSGCRPAGKLLFFRGKYLRTANIPRNGDSLFQALSCAMFAEGDRAASLREDVVCAVCAEWDTVGSMLQRESMEEYRRWQGIGQL